MGAFWNTCKTRPEAQRAPPSDQQLSRCRIRSFRSKNDWRLVHLRIAPLLAEASSANPHLHSPPECAAANEWHWPPKHASAEPGLEMGLGMPRGLRAKCTRVRRRIARRSSMHAHTARTRAPGADCVAAAIELPPIRRLSETPEKQRAAASATRVDANLRTIWVECM